MAEGNGVERKSRAVQKGVSVMDLIFRILAVIGTLGSAFAMATTYQRLPFFNSFTQFKAKYRDIPAFVCVAFLFQSSINNMFCLCVWNL